MERPNASQRGFVLALTIILVMGVSALSVGIMYTGKMGRMSSVNYQKKIQTFMASEGLMTLLAQELINGKGDKYVDMSRMGRIKGEVWHGLAGNNVNDFISKTKSTSPDEVIYSYYLGSNIDKDNYGIKWTGWIIPPLSGNYTFYTRSDDQSAFFLSTDEKKTNLSSSPVCWLNGWVYRWPTSGDPVSKPIPLVGGNRYYFEYYHKEGGGYDVGQVGWDGPEYFGERPITGSYLSEYASDPAWAGTVTVGSIPVRYQVLGTGQDRYRVFTESIQTKAGSPKDTAFRTPLVQSISLKGVATAPPSKMHMRVIHYDFPSDGRANEFNMPLYVNWVQKGMVNTLLTDFTTTDASWFGRPRIPKPTRRPNSIANCNCGLNKWFRLNTGNDFWIPKYAAEDAGNPAWFANCSNTKYDPSGDNWRNRRVYDSLEFVLDPNEGPSTYVFSRMGNYDTGDPVTSWRGDVDEYFPIDHLGPDPVRPGNRRNYSFCTELHTTFIHQSGLKFEFTGDDDVWVFINDSLVIDLGGLHPATNSIIQLDDLRSLRYGEVYNFDFFQCERHEDRSSSRIVTNIKMIPPLGKPVAGWRRDYNYMD
jgi:fibro-slime domain-containing protein